MTHDDIIRMAREAGMQFQGGFVRVVECVNENELERFAALVAAHEREACALVCESTITPNIDWWNDACQHCATTIRARGEV